MSNFKDSPLGLVFQLLAICFDMVARVVLLLCGLRYLGWW